MTDENPGEDPESDDDTPHVEPPTGYEDLVDDVEDLVDAGAGVPDSDPSHLDPAGDVADLFESGELEASLTDDADREALREFVDRADRGEFEADPGAEAAVRIARALLDGEEQG